MSAFAPTSIVVVLQLGLLLAATLAAGLASSRKRGRGGGVSTAWTLVVAATLAAERLAAGEPPGARMLAIVAALLWSMKAVVSVEAAASGVVLTPLRWLAFAAAWPGMRPAAFTSLGAAPRPGGGRLVARGVAFLAAGGALVALAAVALRRTGSLALATLLLLPGLSLALHFGAFAVVAGLWRLAGAECQPLFRAPLRARSLREFWGRRWNLAFSEMTAAVVYRPLARETGPALGLIAAFALSGVFHELAISVPVRAGFGGPLAYFLLHGALVLVEGGLEKAGRGIDRRPALGALWTLGWLVVPLPLLFHAPFLRGVLWPLLGA